MPIDLSRSRFPPYAHQVVGVQALVHSPFFLLADTMGLGKTKQAIDAAQVLYTRGDINRIIVVAPASVRSVWYDAELGELRKHLWEGIDAQTTEFHSKLRQWFTGVEDPRHAGLKIIVTNYDFIRAKVRLAQLLPYATDKTVVIGDESSSIKNHQAEQTKAFLQLRKRAGRVWLLNGTPIANHPGDMYSQGNIMSPLILDRMSWFQFRARYAILGGFKQKQIVGWRPEGVEDIQKRFAPYVLRRLKEDCLDLPEKLPPVVVPVALTEKVWDIYRNMRDECVAWLTSSSVSMAPQAITKVMRLSQITSGFLGGVQGMDLSSDAHGEWMDSGGAAGNGKAPVLPVEEIGREKLDMFFAWLDRWLDQDPSFKPIVWSRFSPEIARAVRETRLMYPHIPVGIIAGVGVADSKKADREFALRLLDPRTAPAGPAIVFGNAQSGGLGLNMTASHTMIRLSNDYSQMRRAQSDDRIHRPGQVHAVSYFDFVATGPKGQKTIDAVILEALMKKENLAALTTRAWVQMIVQE